MKIYCFYTIVCVFTLSYTSCNTRARQNQIVGRDAVMSEIDGNNLLKIEQIKSMIEIDQKKRQMGAWSIKQSASSPLFYEAICDDGLYLYRYIQQGDDSSVIILEDNNISYLVDCIEGFMDYEHKGYYKIVGDSTVDVIFDEWYRNYCQPDDTIESAHLYHIQCTHSYKLTDMRWKSIKKDTIILKDERSLFCGDEISKYIY